MLEPIAKPGALSDEERFMFETFGYLIIPDALDANEVAACVAASERAHAPYPKGEWRQLGHLHETEPAIEALIDHPAVFSKVRALLGDYFILQSAWCTTQPAGGGSGGWHQDGSSVYEFRRLGTPTPLMQLRVGYYLTDQSQPNQGNMAMIPGSHNASLKLPKSVKPDSDFPLTHVVCGKPGTALLFHQGVWHRSHKNEMAWDRYTMHVVYAPPWLIPSDRTHNSREFLARTTPLRRALAGEWQRPEEPFGVGYARPPFGD